MDCPSFHLVKANDEPDQRATTLAKANKIKRTNQELFLCLCPHYYKSCQVILAKVNDPTLKVEIFTATVTPRTPEVKQRTELVKYHSKLVKHFTVTVRHPIATIKQFIATVKHHSEMVKHLTATVK